MGSFHQLGVTAVGQQDYAKAESCFREAIDRDRTDWLNYVLLSAVLDCCGNPVQASSVLVDFCCALDLFGAYQQAAAVLDAQLEALETAEGSEIASLAAWLTLYRAMVSRFCAPGPVQAAVAVSPLSPAKILPADAAALLSRPD